MTRSSLLGSVSALALALAAQGALAGNTANVSQSGLSDAVSITQVGSNDAEINQTGTNDSATVSQTGSGNLVDSSHYGYGQSNTNDSYTASQEGIGNQAWEYQYGTNASATTDQNGNNNTLYV